MSKDLIVKDNRFIEAKYNLTLNQSKFIAFMCSYIQPDDSDFFTYEIRLNKLLETIGVKRSHWKDLVKTLQELMTMMIPLEVSDDVVEMTTLLSHFRVDRKNDKVEFRFDKSMKPYLLQLSKAFTQLSLKKILSFRSSYSIRMYEIIQKRVKQYEKYKNHNLLDLEIDLQELKELLCGTWNNKKEVYEIPKSYQRWDVFKKMVLDVAKEELQEKGDYYFDYEYIKENKKIVGLVIHILGNKEKVKKDFRKNKMLIIKNKRYKGIFDEQIRRQYVRMELQGKIINDKIKYENKLYNMFLRGDLNLDKDLQEILEQLQKEELEK